MQALFANRTMSTDYEKYELFLKQVMESLVGVTVHHHCVYTGRVSNRDIKVDLSFNYEIANGADVLFIVECKCYSHPVSVDDVEEFHSKIDDIGAHKGIMVTTVGFQEGAIKTAKGRGIALALLTAENQPGELRYIVNTVGTVSVKQVNKGFWQGNFRGPLDNYEGGLRFENMGQFLGMLSLDEKKKERKKAVEAWKKGHGSK
jgi:hypothetical protein